MSMTHLTHPDTGASGGNTNPSAPATKDPSQKKRSRGWVFTINNYDPDTMTHLTQVFCMSGKDTKYCMGYEVGDDGTPHIQGWVRFKNARHFDAVKKIMPRAHIESQAGSNSKNLIYCSKQGEYTTNCAIISWHRPEKIPDLTRDTLNDWQRELEDLLVNNEPNRRTIYWYWSNKGGVGKSQFCEYMDYKYEQVEVCSTTRDGDIPMVASNDVCIYLFDWPRATSKDHLPWNALEQLKNGIISDGKLKRAMRRVRIQPPHVVVFCNFAPPFGCVSDDRLIVKNLDF